MTFKEYMNIIWGYDPFPWQERLAEKSVSGDWPEILDLPTGTGKTSVIDIALYTMYKQQNPKNIRIVYVVDRRTVVDQTYQRALHIKNKIMEDPRLECVKNKFADICGEYQNKENPLVVSYMRGGVEKNMEWAEFPHKPAILISTVDQVGSRLLFRGYGENRKKWPIHAGLLSQKTIHLLDEVHLSGPYRDTLKRIEKEKKWGADIGVIEMSATHGKSSGSIFSLDHFDLEHPILSKRTSQDKIINIIGEECKNSNNFREFFIKSSCKLAIDSIKNNSHKIVSIVTNRVASAQKIYSEIKNKCEYECILMTSRIRGYDRQSLEQKLIEKVKTGRDRKNDTPTIIISTQCIEAGADFDFDCMITESASLDSLIQRFGRLNRIGEYPNYEGHIIYPIITNENEEYFFDPVYGQSYLNTCKYIKTINSINMNKIEKSELKDCFNLIGSSPYLSDKIMETFFYTTSDSQLEKYNHPVNYFLHGEKSENAEVSVIWRSHFDISESDLQTLKKCPPVSGESMSLPIKITKELLTETKKKVLLDISDIEFLEKHDEDELEETRSFMVWLGDDSFITNKLSDLKPGFTIVVPDYYGGIDPETKQYWLVSNDHAKNKVEDVYLKSCKMANIMPVLRMKIMNDVSYNEEISQYENIKTIEDKIFSKYELESEIKISQWLQRENVITLLKKSQNSKIKKTITLQDHLKDVANVAKEYATICELDQDDFYTAGMFHDIGKSDFRFQKWLYDGVPTEIAIAKSGKALSLSKRKDAGLPSGYQHATTSYVIMKSFDDTFFQGANKSRVAHLVTTHHGWYRPFPPECSEIIVDVEYEDTIVKTDPKLYNMDNEISQCFIEYCKEKNFYKIAYEEAVFRLSDHEGSRIGSCRED